MSKRCSMLVWIKPVDPIYSVEASAMKFHPGDVVEIQPGDFDFGTAIKELGWWKVVSVTGPMGMLRKLTEGDAEEPETIHWVIRRRKFRLDSTKLKDKMKCEEVLAIIKEVPRPTISSIG